MFNQIKTTSYLLAAIILSLAFFPAHAQEEISNEDFKKLIAIQKSKISNMELLTQQQAKLITDLSGKLDAVTKVATQLEKQVANAQKVLTQLKKPPMELTGALYRYAILIHQVPDLLEGDSGPTLVQITVLLQFMGIVRRDLTSTG